MQRIFTILYLSINASLLFAQVPLTLEGIVIDDPTTGEWYGFNVPRSVPTTLIFRNNSITSVNTMGYMLQAGDEGIATTNNNLDGEIITGNKFTWNGTDMTSITHGVFTGYNLNAVIKYNYLKNVPMGLIRKSNGMTNTSGGVAYNIVINPNIGFVAKGINNVNVYNNTFFSTRTATEARRGIIDIYANTDNGLNAPSTGTKIKNNIFYTKYQIYNIYINESACLTGFESDYNVFYCEAGTPIFNYLGSLKTFAQWQALGFDIHSVVVNPNFLNFTDLVPAVRLNYGTDLGPDWQTGLSVNAFWGATDPATSNQNGIWQVGARVYYLPVTNINVTGAGGANTITTENGTLQLSAVVLPANATDKTVTWSIVNGTGQAVINATGLVTSVDNGTVIARATANDGSGVYGTLTITISNQVIPVTGITVTGAGGANTITTDDGTLQLFGSVLPVNATNNSVTWTIVNGTGQAVINSTGLVTAVDNGTVTARATANDGSGVYGTLTITNSNQVVLVTGITVTGASGATTITTDNGTLQLFSAVLPVNATNKTVTWSIINGTGQATINATGLVTAVDNGTVTARATTNDGSGVYGTMTITNSNQVVLVTGITVTGAGGATSIFIDNGTLQLSVAILPVNAADKSVTWSIINETGQATINSAGLVTAVDNGTVTARATANDGSGVYGSLTITNSSQLIPVNGITVTGAGGANTITTDNGTLQLSVSVLPANASDKTITWSIVNGTGEATINSAGLVTAVDNGTVTARATANDGSGVYGTLIIANFGQLVPVNGITVNGAGGANSITTDNGILQLSAVVLPANAIDKTVTWSIVNGTGQATINATGLVTAVNNGTVTARATANDGSGIYGTLTITNSNQLVTVTGITVTGAGGSNTITTDNGTLQLSALVLPANAIDKTVNWSIINGTGQATINATGLVTAADNGTVTARATANDGSGVYGTLTITISSQVVPVTGITLTGAGGANTITTDDGTLQLFASVLPANASNKTVTWALFNGTGQATINSAGLVIAIKNGTVIARATANDGSGVYGTLTITNTNQEVPVTGITVTGAGGANTITTDNGTLQLTANVFPANASNRTVTWSIVNGTGQATINASGLVTAVDNGIVTARATANDGSGVYGTLTITNSNQEVPVTGITVEGAGGANTITTDNGTLQLTAIVFPAYATNTTVTWSIVNGTGQATINASGLVTAIDNGIVTARATANDGSGVFGTLIITNSNQLVLVTGITVTGAGGANTITNDNGTLQLSASVLPFDASDKSVAWSIANGTGQATINVSGLVTAVDNGTVTARATANDGSGISGTIIITNSNQRIHVTGITIAGAGGATAITTENGTLQLSAAVVPVNASIQTVTWSIINGTGRATINSTGLVTGIQNGTVTAFATANDGFGGVGSLDIPIIIKKKEPIKIIVTDYEIKLLLNDDYSSCKAGLYNLRGALLLSRFVESNIFIFNISSLQAGIYFILLSNGVNIYDVQKIIIGR